MVYFFVLLLVWLSYVSLLYNTTVDNHLKAKPSKEQASQRWQYVSSFCPMRSWTSPNQPLQSVYTPKPHMRFSPPSQQRSLQRRLPSRWPPSMPASDHRTHNPQTTKKKKKKKREKKKKLTHASPLAAKPTDQSLAADPSATCRRHHHCRSGRQPPPSLVPSLSSSSIPVPPSSHHHSRRSPTPQSRCRSTFYLEILFSYSFCVFLFFSFCPWFAFPLESIIWISFKVCNVLSPSHNVFSYFAKKIK